MDLPGDIRKRSGGARPGAGHPPGDSELFFGKVRRETRVKLERFSKSRGIKREKGKCYFDRVILALLELAQSPEPEYMSLIPKG